MEYTNTQDILSDKEVILNFQNRLNENGLTSRSFVDSLNAMLVGEKISTEDYTIAYSEYGVRRLNDILNDRVKYLEDLYDSKYNYNVLLDLYHDMHKHIYTLIETIDAASNNTVATRTVLKDKNKLLRYASDDGHETVSMLHQNIIGLLDTNDFVDLLTKDTDIRVKIKDYVYEYKEELVDKHPGNMINTLSHVVDTHNAKVPYLHDLTHECEGCPYPMIRKATYDIITLEDFIEISPKLSKVSKILTAVDKELTGDVFSHKRLDVVLYIDITKKLIEMIESPELKLLLRVWKEL